MKRVAHHPGRSFCSQLVCLVVASGLLISATPHARAQSGGVTQGQSQRGSAGPGQQQQPPTAPPPAATAPGDRRDGERPNGISVGRPKVFDNRTLTIMLESLSEALRGMQTQLVNQQALAAAFSYLQGSQSREVVSNLSVSPLPIPSLKQESITNTGNVAEAGTPLPDTTKVTTTSDRAAFTPQAPALDNPPAFSGFTPTYGESPSDLLSDQVNLTYQIFNLRMLLERSLSDRVLSGAQTQPRRQAVLGFNVTIDPPRTTENAVAVVEVTLELPAGASGDGLSLVSLMPQEKTYNAAALSTKSNSFGGAAVVKLFQVGYSERRRGQIFYLYRDNDTVSYERMNGGKTNQLVFGWAFRPVLGRRSVSPGMRQLFAIVSLPSDDARANANPQMLNARVKTYWKKYDRDTMTSFTEGETNRATRFKQALSFNLTKPEIFSKRYVNTATYDGIEVKSTNKYQSNLRPEVAGVWWVPVGPRSALVSVTGNNFFSGTRVTMGDKVYASAADGLVIKSDQAIDINTGLDALASGPGAIIGRYGPAVPLIAAAANPTDGIKVGNVRLGPALSGNHSLEIELLHLTKSTLALADLPSDAKVGRLTPIVTVNGNVAPMPYTLVEKTHDNPNGVTLQTLIPSAFLSGGGAVVKVSWPFRSDGWTATGRVYDPAATYRVLRLDAKRIVVMTSDPRGFRSIPGSAVTCWTLLAGNENIKLPSDTCTETPPPGVTKYSNFAVDVKLAADAPDKVVLVSPERYPYSVEVPKAATAESPAPKPIELKQFDAVWVAVAVKDVSKVASVEANQLSLRFRKGQPDKEGAPAKTIQVQITREITAKPGDVDITVLDGEGNPIGGARLRISPCEDCEGNGGK